MRCDQCQHWNLSDEDRCWDAKAAGLGICEAIKEGWTVADKASSGLPRDNSMPLEWEAEKPDPADRYMAARASALKEAKAVAWDGSEYRAWVYTTVDFGCVLFEAKS
jgi:hypothetical protein